MARGTIITRTLKDGKTKRHYAALWTPKDHEGKRKHVWKTFERKKDAEEYLDRESRAVRDGEYIEPSRMLFSKFGEEWFQRLREKGMKESTRAGYESNYRNHLLPFFGNRFLGSIRGSTIEREFKPLLPATLSSRTVRMILSLLRTMFDTAVEWDYLRVNPFYQRAKVKLPKMSHEQKGRGLTPEEAKKLLDAAYDLGYTMIATAVFTGMRLSELLAVRWEDVDFDKNQIHVRRSLSRKRGKFGATGFEFVVPKSEKSIRRIDLSPRLKKILLEHKLASPVKSSHGLVFCNSLGNPIDRARFMKEFFYPAWKSAGIGYLRFHDLRHTFGSLKIHQGENLKYVQVQMGHASIKVTMDVYGHLLQDTNPQAAAKTDDLVFGASC